MHCSSVMSYLNGTKFTMEVPFTQEGHIPNLKKIPLAISEIQASKLSKKLLFFFLLDKIDVTQKCVLQSSWNLEHLLGLKRLINLSFKFGVNLVNSPRVINNFTHEELLSHPQVEPVQGTSWKSLHS